MKLSQFKFKLPEDKIALHPMKYRDESRLMVLHRNTGKIEHKMFKDVLDSFDDKDVFIFNDTKVFPARLYGNKEKTGARIEVDKGFLRWMRKHCVPSVLLLFRNAYVLGYPDLELCPI